MDRKITYRVQIADARITLRICSCESMIVPLNRMLLKYDRGDLLPTGVPVISRELEVARLIILFAVED